MRSSLGFLLAGAIAAAAAIVACGGGGAGSTGDGFTAGGGTSEPSGGGTGGGRFDSIDVEPPSAEIKVALGKTGTQSYKVFGITGGKKTDITSTCALEVDQDFGSFSGATLDVAAHGGTTKVGANCGTQNGSSKLTVDLSGSVVTGMNTPANAPDLFKSATAGSDASRLPSVEYPVDQAVAPLNIPSIEMQWTAAGSDLFHVALSSPNLTIDVYTSDVQATLSETDWTTIAGTAAGSTLSLSVEGLLQSAPTTKYAGPKVGLKLSHDTIDKTAIYYWASSLGDLMTQTFGQTGAPQQVEGNCTACHAVARSGSRIGYSRCVANDCSNLNVGFLHYDKTAKTWDEVVNADQGAIPGSFTTFSPIGNPFPNDSKSVAIVTKSSGTLSLFDPDSGMPIASNLDDIATHGDGAPRSALMADWSADGKTVVFASTPHPEQWIDLSDGAIATMSYKYTGATHVFGEPNFIVKPPLTLNGGSFTNLFFPSFSPDGELIVFNAAHAAWRNLTDESVTGPRLVLTNAKGDWVTDLTALNRGADDNDMTWAHWAPGTSTDYYWVVFSSERSYGHVLTPGNTSQNCVANGTKQCKQLWIAAIDKKKVLGGKVTIDPSAAPMWLPGQDITADNISPYWTVPVTAIPR
jgi:hypothetical protein